MNCSFMQLLLSLSVFIVGTSALFYLLSRCYIRCTHQYETTGRLCYDIKQDQSDLDLAGTDFMAVVLMCTGWFFGGVEFAGGVLGCWLDLLASLW